MDHQLLIDFDTEAMSFSSVIRLSDLEIQEIQNLICYRFGIDLDNVWCWENMAHIDTIIEYGNENGLNKIKLLFNTNPVVKLVVTDEDTPPWFGFKGKVFDLLEVVNKLRYFEFFIVNEDCNIIVFDTHQNALVLSRNI